jgi:hypothetical protein
MVGVMLILARLMRLGFVANFISAPVLTGFKAGSPNDWAASACCSTRARR